MIMKLDEFKTLEQKEKLFGSLYECINTKDDFDNWEKGKRNTKNKMVFRGLKDAKLRLYTSAQREWLIRDYEKQGIKFVDFVNSILRNVKKDRLLKRYFNAFKITTNDWLYLSYLQHYGAPTPFLDFSHNLKKSLFFATDGLTTNSITKKAIDNYFSIYYVTLNEVGKEDFSNYLEFSHEFAVETNQIKRLDNSFFEENIIFEKNFIDRILFIPNPLKIRQTKNNKIFVWSNLNIVAQDGCFFLYHNCKDNTLPFESYFKEYHYNTIELHCVDIHKSLADYVRNKIKLTKKDVYPELKELALEPYETFKKQLK